MRVVSLTPSRIVLLTPFKLLHADDPLAGQAADRLLDHHTSHPVSYAFDGATLCVKSFGHAPDAIYRCTATTCTCRGGRHPWCQHRVLFMVLQAEAALRVAPSAGTQATDRDTAFVQMRELWGEG